jgi:hypothetical protein
MDFSTFAKKHQQAFLALLPSRRESLKLGVRRREAREVVL